MDTKLQAIDMREGWRLTWALINADQWSTRYSASRHPGRCTVAERDGGPLRPLAQGCSHLRNLSVVGELARYYVPAMTRRGRDCGRCSASVLGG